MRHLRKQTALMESAVGTLAWKNLNVKSGVRNSTKDSIDILVDDGKVTDLLSCLHVSQRLVWWRITNGLVAGRHCADQLSTYSIGSLAETYRFTEHNYWWHVGAGDSITHYKSIDNKVAGRCACPKPVLSRFYEVLSRSIRYYLKCVVRRLCRWRKVTLEETSTFTSQYSLKRSTHTTRRTRTLTTYPWRISIRHYDHHVCV